MKVLANTDQLFRTSKDYLYNVAKAIQHPKYSMKGITYNDIGLLKLDRKINFQTGRVEPIKWSQKTNIKPNTVLNVAGWGKDEVNHQFF